MAFRRSLSESRLTDRRRGLPLPLVRRVEELGSGLPRSYSLMSLAASQTLAAAGRGGEKPAPRSQPRGYSRPSWFWRYGPDTGWLDQRAHHASVLGTRFWPSIARFRRTYDAGRSSFTYPSWQGIWNGPSGDRSSGPCDRKRTRDYSYYQSQRSWVRSSYTSDDFLDSSRGYTYSLKMPFFNYTYHKPRTAYMYFY